MCSCAHAADRVEGTLASPVLAEQTAVFLQLICFCGLPCLPSPTNCLHCMCALAQELYLIRLSKARRTLVCSPPTPSPAVPGTGVCSQAYAGHPYAGMTVAGKAGAWLAERGSTIWRRGSAIMNPGHLRNLADENEVEVCDSGFSQMHEADVATGDGRASPFSLVARDSSRHSCKSATAAADSSRHSCKSFAADEERKDGMGGEIDCVEVTAYIVPAGSGQKQHQQPPPRMHTSSSDGIPLLSPPGTRTHSLSAGIGAAPAALSDKPSDSKPGKQQAQCELQGSLSSGLNNMQRAAVQNSRQPSFEEFCRAPSLLGPAAKQKAGMQGVRNWLGVGGPRGSRTSKAAGSRIGSHVSLRDMVPGVDGMLLQPEVVEEVTNNGRTMVRHKQSLLPSLIGPNMCSCGALACACHRVLLAQRTIWHSPVVLTSATNSNVNTCTLCCTAPAISV